MVGNYTITLSDGVTTFDIFDLEQNGPGNLSTSRSILAIDLTGGAGTNFIKISDDLTFRFIAGQTLNIIDSSGGLNDGVFTTVSSSYAAGPNETTIVLTEALTSTAVPLGRINYSIPSTEEATSLLLPGRGTLNFGDIQNTSFVHLLENFSHNVEPVNPITGQLWYNPNVDELRHYDGTAFVTNMAMSSGTITFVDPQHPTDPTNPTLQMTGDDSDVGMSITVTTDPNPLDSIFRVLSSAGSERLRVEHDGYTRTTNSLDVQGTAISTFASSIRIPNNQNLETPGGATITTNAAGEIWQMRPGAVGQASLIVQNSASATLFQVRGDGNTEVINSLIVDSSTLVVDSALNTVGIGNAAPSVPLDVVGESNFTSGPLVMIGDGVGSIGETNGVLKFNNGTSDFLFIGEGQDDASVAPDIRALGSMLQSAVDDFIISFNGDNLGTNEFSVRAGAHNTTATKLFKVENDGTVSVDTAAYETLVLADNDIPNKKYVDDEINTSNFQIIDEDNDTFVRTSSGPLTDEDTIEMALGTGTGGWTPATIITLTDSSLSITSLNAVSSSTNDGASINITSGDGDPIGANGGNLNITTGTATIGAGGTITLQAGAGGSTSGDGGPINIISGSTTDGNAGDIAITGSNATGTNRNGGNINITAGNPTGVGIAGDIKLTPGDSGNITINSSTTVVPELQFFELSPGTEYVSFKSPDAITTSRTWVLPQDDPAVASLTGKALVTDSAGNLSFAQPVPNGRLFFFASF